MNLIFSASEHFQQSDKRSPWSFIYIYAAGAHATVVLSVLVSVHLQFRQQPEPCCIKEFTKLCFLTEFPSNMINGLASAGVRKAC